MWLRVSVVIWNQAAPRGPARVRCGVRRAKHALTHSAWEETLKRRLSIERFHRPASAHKVPGKVEVLRLLGTAGRGECSSEGERSVRL
jgi:hypothetical protein